MVNRKKCKTNPNNFCYVCGKYTLPAHRQNIEYKIITAIKYYFGCKVPGQDKKMGTSYLLQFLQHSATSVGCW